MAVVGPERSDFLPAIAALVPFSTAITAVDPIIVVFIMISGGCRHHRRGTKPFILA